MVPVVACEAQTNAVDEGQPARKRRQNPSALEVELRGVVVTGDSCQMRTENAADWKLKKAPPRGHGGREDEVILVACGSVMGGMGSHQETFIMFSLAIMLFGCSAAAPSLRSCQELRCDND